MNAEKHESSLLKVVSDVGSTPAASTILKSFIPNDLHLRTKNRVDFCTVFCTVAGRV
jgi:hypothetical protein